MAGGEGVVEVSGPAKFRLTVTALTVSASVLMGTAMKEGYRDTAYPDPATGGAPWTIGYGETKGTKPGQRTDPVHALVQLGKSLDDHAAGVARCITAPLSQGEFDASVDLAYNIGVGAFCSGSVAKRFNALDYWGGCMAFLLYTKGRVRGQLVNMPGLVSRRWDNYYTCLGS